MRILDAVEDDAAITEPLDRAMLADLAGVVADATAAFEDYNYAKALDLAEAFFWSFTDDYVEIVKDRAYGVRGEAAAASAKAALATALSTQLRLFAPFLPFVTDEVWSWWQEGSVHRASWPQADRLLALATGADRALVDDVAAVLTLIRKAKSEASASMKAEVASAVITAPAESRDRLETVADDIAAVGRISALSFADGPAIEVSVVLAEG